MESQNNAENHSVLIAGKDNLELIPNTASKIEILVDPEAKKIDGTEVKKLADEAVGIIDKYLPDWKPQQESRIVVWNTEAKTGEYLGKWGDKHNLLITVSNNDLRDPEERSALTLRIAHELLHQRVSEILGVDDINGFGIETKLKHEKVQKMTDYEKFEVIFGSMARASLMQKIISEGCALYGEQVINTKILADGSTSKELKVAAKNMITEREADLVESEHDPYSTYSAGKKLISNLLAVFEDKSLTEILKNINWQACTHIKSDSSQHQELINNPKNIPGLSNQD